MVGPANDVRCKEERHWTTYVLKVILSTMLWWTRALWADIWYHQSKTVGKLFASSQSESLNTMFCFILKFYLFFLSTCFLLFQEKKGCALKFNIFFYKDQKIEKIISVIYPVHSSYEDFFPRAEKNYSSPFIPHSPKGLLYVKEAVAFPFLPFDPWKALVCKTGSYFLITGALTKVQTIWD